VQATGTCSLLSVTATCSNLNNTFPSINKGIQELKLKDENVFSQFTKDDFQNFTNLMTLNFPSAKLQQIAGDTFEVNTKLTDISLYDNLLTQIKTATFANLPVLKKLDLSTNQLTAIEDGAFTGSPITSLRLDENSFSSFPKSALVSLRASLENLYLSDCKNSKLGTIKKDDLSGFTKLKVLQLENCGISTIEAKAFEGLNLDGKELKVGRNPFKCDCSLLPFIKYAKQTLDAVTFAQLECATPTKQKLAAAADSLTCGSSSPAFAWSKLLGVVTTMLTFLWALNQ